MSTASIDTARRRQWVDTLAIIAGVATFAGAIWGPLLSTGGMSEVRYKDYVWIMYAVAGGAAIASVFLAQRRPRPARALLALAGLLLLSSLFAFRDFGWRSWLTILVPGLIMLVASPFLGVMPRPEHASGPEEAHPAGRTL